jgi:hypothetical protein
MNFKILIESAATVPLKGRPARDNQRRSLANSPEPERQEALSDVQAFNFYFLSNNFDSLSVLLNYDTRAGNGKTRLIRALVTKIPPLSSNKIIKKLGAGSFGTTFLLANDHVLKLFMGGLDDHSNWDVEGVRDLNRYEELAKSQFDKKALKSDLMIYDSGSIKFKGSSSGPIRLINYAEMQKLVTLVEFYKLCIKDKITSSRQKIFKVMPRSYNPYAPELNSDIATLKDLARILYYKKKTRNTEEFNEEIRRHSQWGFYADQALYSIVRKKGTLEVVRTHYLERNLTEILGSMKILSVEFGKILLVQMVKVSKTNLMNLRDVRPLNIGILPQDSFTPVLYDY